MAISLTGVEMDPSSRYLALYGRTCHHETQQQDSWLPVPGQRVLSAYERSPKLQRICESADTGFFTDFNRLTNFLVK